MLFIRLLYHACRAEVTRIARRRREPEVSIECPVSSFEHPEFGIQPNLSNPSCFAVETNGHIVAVDNDGHLAGSVGMFQHGIQLAGIRNDIMILHGFAFLFECFPSSVGVRSGIFSIN